jgi:hypothetical protein
LFVTLLMDSDTAIDWTSVSADSAPEAGNYLVVVRAGYGLVVGRAAYADGRWYGCRHPVGNIVAYSWVSSTQ